VDNDGGHEIDERIARLIMRLDEVRGVAECAVCGVNNWDYGAVTVAMPQTTPNPNRAGLVALPMICRNCGYVRLHSAHHLEQRDH